MNKTKQELRHISAEKSASERTTPGHVTSANLIYGIAIIGCGYMGEKHMAGIIHMSNINMVCACDTDMEKAKQFQNNFGFQKITTDARECIDDPNVDIVIISTYPSTHLHLLKMCLERKKHVLCEKPISTNETDAVEFVRLVKESQDSKVLIGMILRHNNTYRRIAEMIHNGAIGFPLIFHMVQNHHAVDWSRHLRLISETSPIIDCGVHYLDVMRWFSRAHITQISGTGRRTEDDVPDGCYNCGSIVVQLSDGSIGHFEVNWGKNIPAKYLKEFNGPLGSISLIRKEDRCSNQEEGDLIEYFNNETNEYQTFNVSNEHKPTSQQLEYLIQMIEQDISEVPSIDEIYEGLQAALKADSAIINHQIVYLESAK